MVKGTELTVTAPADGKPRHRRNGDRPDSRAERPLPARRFETVVDALQRDGLRGRGGRGRRSSCLTRHAPWPPPRDHCRPD